MIRTTQHPVTTLLVFNDKFPKKCQIISHGYYRHFGARNASLWQETVLHNPYKMMAMPRQKGGGHLKKQSRMKGQVKESQADRQTLFCKTSVLSDPDEKSAMSDANTN